MRPVLPPPTALDPTALAARSDAAQKANEKRDAEALNAARQFESLLIRQMLESLQKTTGMGSGKSHASNAYQSMAVDALADGLGQAGGLGMADLIVRTLQAELAGKRGP